MKETFKDIATTVATVAVAGVVIWGLTYQVLVYTGYFAPKFENVRRKTFENSKSFRDGSIQELQNMQFEYIKSSPEHQLALKSIILRRAATVPQDALTPELKSFISELTR